MQRGKRSGFIHTALDEHHFPDDFTQGEPEEEPMDEDYDVDDEEFGDDDYVNNYFDGGEGEGDDDYGGDEGGGGKPSHNII